MTYTLPTIVTQKLKGARAMRCANCIAFAGNHLYKKKWTELADYIVVKGRVAVVHPYPEKGEDRMSLTWPTEQFGTAQYAAACAVYDAARKAEHDHIEPYCDAIRPALNWVYDKHFKKDECYIAEDRWSEPSATTLFWFFHPVRAADAAELVKLGGRYL